MLKSLHRGTKGGGGSGPPGPSPPGSATGSVGFRFLAVSHLMGCGTWPPGGAPPGGAPGSPLVARAANTDKHRSFQVFIPKKVRNFQNENECTNGGALVKETFFVLGGIHETCLLREILFQQLQLVLISSDARIGRLQD